MRLAIKMFRQVITVISHLLQGVYRQVPLLSSVMNWWSPPAKTAIPGRTLNLSKGNSNYALILNFSVNNWYNISDYNGVLDNI